MFKLLAVVFLAGGLICGCPVQAEETWCSRENISEKGTPHFVVRRGTVQLPVGPFLLIRKNGAIGAIRITSIDSRATEFFGKAHYEAFFQEKMSARFPESAVARQGEVDVQDLKGPGRGIYVYRPSGYKAQIGKWKLDFETPDSISMSDSSFWTGKVDHGFEFAPTSACRLSEIDTTDKRLRWFHWDKTTQITLPLVDLPK